MEKFIDLLSRFLVPLAEKLSNNRYLAAISNGFSRLLPVVMVGAIFTLLANLQIAPYQSFVSATHLKEIFAFAPTVTTDMLALYAVYMIGDALARNLKHEDHAIVCGSVSLLAFLVLIPLGVTGKTEAGETVTVAAALSTQYLGSAGLFSAIIVGLIVPTIYCFFIDRNITIKMPPQVPPTISKSFGGMIPGFAVAFLFGLLRLVMSFTSYGDVNTFIYTLLKTPLAHLGASPVTFIVLIVMCSLLWFFGLHGGLVVMPFLTMLYLPLSLENLDALSNGAQMTNIIVKSMWPTAASLGGAGGTIGLCLYLAFFAKAERYKVLGRLALPAGLCGINEPITFGLPVVLNPIVLIPLVVTPVITFLITYICLLTGIIPFFNGTEIPLGTPVILSAIVANGWQFAVLQVILLMLQFVIWFPFAKILDREALKDEAAQANVADGAAN